MARPKRKPKRWRSYYIATVFKNDGRSRIRFAFNGRRSVEDISKAIEERSGGVVMSLKENWL